MLKTDHRHLDLIFASNKEFPKTVSAKLTIELAKRIIRRVVDSNWQASTQGEIVLKKLYGSLIIENGLVHNGTISYIPPRTRNFVIQRAHDTRPDCQTTEIVALLKKN